MTDVVRSGNMWERIPTTFTPSLTRVKSIILKSLIIKSINTNSICSNKLSKG